MPLVALLALLVPSTGLMSASAVNSLPEWFEREGYGKAGLKHESLGGGAGWASTARLTTAAGERFFVKESSRPAAQMFAGEALGLRALADASARAVAAGLIDDGAALRVPKVYAAEDVKSGRGSFIVMEWLDLGGRTDQAALGRAMGALHAAPCPDEWRDKPFGFACDNTIGATPQPNARSRDWVEFFRERRLAHQLALARSPKLSRLGERLLPRLDELFDDLDGGAAVAPSVLHGDLWSGNIGAVPDGAPCVFDPAVYVGHDEAEWGMSWCAGFSTEFWRGYREIVPKAPGFERRRPLYDLYHILNHANLFGGGYHDDAAALMRKCLVNLDG